MHQKCHVNGNIPTSGKSFECWGRGKLDDATFFYIKQESATIIWEL